MTSREAQNTDFSRDILGRYTCNGLDEALASTDTTRRADAKPFDVIIVGGGSFAGVLAQHLFAQDGARRHRVLVLEAGKLALPEHVQNLPVLGLNAPGPVTSDPGVARAEVWGLPWRTDVPKGFPGLAYCLGGRSVFFGGWSPRLLPSEMPAAWPSAMVADLTATDGYFDEAADQIGTSATNDFIFGEMHEALRSQLRQAIDASLVQDAIPLAQLPLHLHNVPAGQEPLYKVEAPLAVQAQPPRSGFFPFNKFSSVPLWIQTARLAQSEAGADDVKKRLMVVPGCHAVRLITDGAATGRRVVAVETDQGSIPVHPDGVVVLALGTIESARLARLSLPGLPTTDRMGANLIGHLRSNVTIRVPRAALASLPSTVNELQASALFVKGRHDHADHAFGHFHLQITAAGLSVPSADSEAELFRKIPDVDTYERFKHITDDRVVITVRGIGEMRPENPNTKVTLGAELDEFHVPRAFVSIQPGSDDMDLWDAMDRASDDVALAFANGLPYEVLVGTGFATVAAGQRAETVLPLLNSPRRDGLGTTHHEAGTLAAGDSSASSVTNADLQFHDVPNLYALGPSVFPTVGSPNPMLTGTALARRLADRLAAFTPAPPDPGFTLLFDGTSMAGWQMSTIRNQPGRDDPGSFLLVDAALEARPGTDIGLLWQTTPTPADFVLRLEWRTWSDQDNSGVFLRFPSPTGKNYDNTAFVGVDFGLEVQIDSLGQPDGAGIHTTGAIYGLQAPSAAPAKPLGEWNAYEITVQGQQYDVRLNGVAITTFTFVPGSDPAHPDRALPTTSGAPRFIGLQTHTGRVAFRRVQIKA
ncbi:MAG TPA: family 16 glycoside hydrolase, partial [Aeromicrobium sp.]|nr:family 16 glycoside hydrolase [Aeromicrobium sp.]